MNKKWEKIEKKYAAKSLLCHVNKGQIDGFHNCGKDGFWAKLTFRAIQREFKESRKPTNSFFEKRFGELNGVTESKTKCQVGTTSG